MVFGVQQASEAMKAATVGLAGGREVLKHAVRLIGCLRHPGSWRGQHLAFDLGDEGALEAK